MSSRIREINRKNENVADKAPRIGVGESVSRRKSLRICVYFFFNQNSEMEIRGLRP